MRKKLVLMLMVFLSLGCLSLSACQTKPSTVSVFDPEQYRVIAYCGDAADFENGGIYMTHSSGRNDLVGEAYDAFIWEGKPGETMPDFPSPDDVEEWSPRSDCLQGGTGIETETRTILFCEGVPNLGDYFLYNLPDCPAVYIPDSVKSIGEHTFAENAITVIHCHAGSYAEQYAKSHGMKYEIVNE